MHVLFSPFRDTNCRLQWGLADCVIILCTGSSEWAVNIQRDSYASYIGHYPLLSYFAVAENESIGRERFNFMQASTSYSWLLFEIYTCTCIYCPALSLPVFLPEKLPCSPYIDRMLMLILSSHGCDPSRVPS